MLPVCLSEEKRGELKSSAEGGLFSGGNTNINQNCWGKEPFFLGKKESPQERHQDGTGLSDSTLEVVEKNSRSPLDPRNLRQWAAKDIKSLERRWRADVSGGEISSVRVQGGRCVYLFPLAKTELMHPGVIVKR